MFLICFTCVYVQTKHKTGDILFCFVVLVILIPVTFDKSRCLYDLNNQ